MKERKKMNRIFTTLLFILTLTTTACVDSVHLPGHGPVPCVGLGDEQDPRFNYGVSGWNLAMGIVFFELIFPPIIVATNMIYCPKSVKRGPRS